MAPDLLVLDLNAHFWFRTEQFAMSSLSSSRPHALNPRALHAMARSLYLRHGRAAAEVAGFFAGEHWYYGDAVRMQTWACVEELVNDMIRGHLGVETPVIN